MILRESLVIFGIHPVTSIMRGFGDLKFFNILYHEGISVKINITEHMCSMP